MVDPLDGTRTSSRGRSGFAVMIGLCVGGRPALGVVLQPTTGRSTARRGPAPSASPAAGASSPSRVSSVTDAGRDPPGRVGLAPHRGHRPGARRRSAYRRAERRLGRPQARPDRRGRAATSTSIPRRQAPHCGTAARRRRSSSRRAAAHRPGRRAARLPRPRAQERRAGSSPPTASCTTWSSRSCAQSSPAAGRSNNPQSPALTSAPCHPQSLRFQLGAQEIRWVTGKLAAPPKASLPPDLPVDGRAAPPALTFDSQCGLARFRAGSPCAPPPWFFRRPPGRFRGWSRRSASTSVSRRPGPA